MQNLLSIILFFSVVVIFGACNRELPADAGEKGEAYLSLTDDGAWCWFSDPRAVYFKGKYSRTYSGWVDSLGNITIGFYDHDRKQVETKIIHARLEKDDHNNPSLLIDREGRLMVFYSKHAARDPLYLARSVNPEDITQWKSIEELRLNDTIAYPDLSDTYTYANICRMADEDDKLYLFWRGADFKPNVSVSDDNGQHWSPGKILVLPERIYRNRRPYLKVATNSKDIIHMAFTDGHPNAEPTNSIYYAKYKGGELLKANGEKIKDWSSLPLAPHEADLVYNATVTKEKAWIWDVADNNGNPVIVYSRFPNDSIHVYYYSIWDDDQWNNYELVNSGGWFPQTPEGEKEREPNYSGGIVLDAGDPSQVYLSREINGIFEIEKWTTHDKGKTWKTTAITRNSAFDNVRPFVTRNYPERKTPAILWLNVKRYRHWTDYQTAVKINIR
jgi:hypothetical protein